MLTINKLITQTNYMYRENRDIKYIVIHYVGATGGAKDNCRYFETAYRGASAHYFVGHEGEIWQCVEDKNDAWHCGAKTYRHPYCRNSNSIGIEMCCRQNPANGTWYFEEKTIEATLELVRFLMDGYNIPITNVIRHYDVSGKVCPEPYVRDAAAWNTFKSRLTTNSTPTGYIVRITADELNVRKGPGTGYGINTVVRKNEAYTIVAENNGWGKLKSGVGWIKLSYTERV